MPYCRKGGKYFPSIGEHKRMCKCGCDTVHNLSRADGICKTSYEPIKYEPIKTINYESY